MTLEDFLVKAGVVRGGSENSGRKRIIDGPVEKAEEDDQEQRVCC